MEYLYATERPDYSDLASGRVFYSLPGHPAFPVRLASEILQRCLALRARAGQEGRCAVYDPCCGAGYLAGVLGYLHRASLCRVIASDWDAEAAALAGRNLGLLQPAGLRRRLAEIAEMQARFGKESHREAYQSGLRMLERVEAEAETLPLEASAFQADAFDAPALRDHFGKARADLVLTDIPYGLHSTWQGQPQAEPAAALLDAMQAVLAPGGLAAVVSAKRQKAGHPAYRRVEHFQVGKRLVTILRWTG